VQDYYATLHVLPSAEDDVIKAAYRALSKRYHPDTITGDKSFATKRMQEINAAFEVLGSPEQRKRYDQARDNASAEHEFSDMADDEDLRFKEDWKLACKFAPEAERCFAYLRKLSNSLAFSFASYLLDSKKFNHSVSIATQFQRDFLGEYFGSDFRIQDFARDLLLCGEVQAAKELNKAVKVMGKSLSYAQTKDEIAKDYPLVPAKLLFLDLAKTEWRCNDRGFAFVNKLGVPVKNFNIINWNYRVTFEGRVHSIWHANLNEWIKENFSDREGFREIWRGPIL
jgi:curved DNA-binding protein CbpA